MDETDRRLLHKKLPCDLAAILEPLQPYQELIATIGIESTFNWYWLVDGLHDHGYHVVLANPTAMQPFYGSFVTYHRLAPHPPAMLASGQVATVTIGTLQLTVTNERQLTPIPGSAGTSTCPPDGGGGGLGVELCGA
jgi:hypothetical protein